MQFRGSGVGHVVSRKWDVFLQSDRADSPSGDKDERFDARNPGDDDAGAADFDIDEDDGSIGWDSDSAHSDSDSQGSDDEVIEDGMDADNGEELDVLDINIVVVYLLHYISVKRTTVDICSTIVPSVACQTTEVTYKYPYLPSYRLDPVQTTTFL